MSEQKQESIRLTSMWARESKNGNTFFVGKNMTFGELRNILKKLKDEEKVTDQDYVAILGFKNRSEHPKSPALDLIIKKDNYKKD